MVKELTHRAGDYIEVPRQMYRDGELTAVQAFWWSEDRVPEELYDLANDPHETVNLAGDPNHADTLASLKAMSEARWDLDAYDAEVRQSQARRWVVYESGNQK